MDLNFSVRLHACVYFGALLFFVLLVITLKYLFLVSLA